MAPSKCPAAVEGDEGTVHGLMHTITIPTKARNRPNVLRWSLEEERKVHTPKGTTATGSQNNRKA